MSKLSEEKKVELSLQEKMMLASRKTSQLQTYLEGVTIGALGFLGIAIISGLFFLNVTLESGTLEALEECNPGPYFEICDKFTFFPDVDSEIIMATLFGAFKAMMIFIIITMILVSAVGIWLFIRGKSIKNELRKIRFDYTNQAYYFALSTATHGKEEDISMDFFEAAQDIFPELKEADIESIKKTGEELEVEDLTIPYDEDESEKDYRFNVVAKTKEGFFLIKHFTKDKVTFSDLVQMIKMGKSVKTWTKGGFRFVCLAKNYDDNAIKNYDTLQEGDDDPIPVDLITIGKRGFSFVKIGV